MQYSHEQLAVVAGKLATTANSQPMCLHCGKHRSSRPRGLCWTCYYTPGVRAQYPANPSIYARRGTDCSGISPAAKATAALPGTVEKLEVMIARAARRETIFHPLDAGMPIIAPECQQTDAKTRQGWHCNLAG